MSIAVPPGFTLSADASGPFLANGSAQIRAKRDDRPLDKALADYSVENLTKGGFTFTDKQDVDALGHKLAVVQAVHNQSKHKHVFALLPDSESSVVVVSASFAPEDELRLTQAVMGALMSVQSKKG